MAKIRCIYGPPGTGKSVACGAAIALMKGVVCGRQVTCLDGLERTFGIAPPSVSLAESVPNATAFIRKNAGQPIIGVDDLGYMIERFVNTSKCVGWDVYKSLGESLYDLREAAELAKSKESEITLILHAKKKDASPFGGLNVPGSSQETLTGFVDSLFFARYDDSIALFPYALDTGTTDFMARDRDALFRRAPINLCEYYRKLGMTLPWPLDWQGKAVETVAQSIAADRANAESIMREWTQKMSKSGKSLPQIRLVLWDAYSRVLMNPESIESALFD